MSSKVRYFKGYWTVEDASDRPHCLFIFGDNDVGRGKGGQAIIRGLDNAIGIPTKKYPNSNRESYYTDNEYELNKQKIDKAIKNIYRQSQHYKYVVFPLDGLGTGLAALPTVAPRTYKYLLKAISILMSNI